MDHFGHLVRYIDVGISPRRVNWFLICLSIWTQLEQYLNPCKWRLVSFKRFWEIGLDTYGHFDLLVTGTFHVSTCEMLKLMTLTAGIGSLNAICNGEFPDIYFLFRVFRDLWGQISLCKWPPPPNPMNIYPKSWNFLGKVGKLLFWGTSISTVVPM